jgi:hypothetical protein
VTALLLAGLLAAQASGGYRVAGVVVNAASGQPVTGARITLAPVERRDQAISTVSGEGGRFAFTGLPQGKYELAGHAGGFLQGRWAGAIVTGPQQNTESMVLRLPAPGVVSGKVVDDAGEPLAEARVELLGSRITDGHRELAPVSSKGTDDTGEYRFPSLQAGTYYVAVSGVPWYTKFNETLGDSAPHGMTHAGYGIRYYPDAGDAAGAEPLRVQAGQEVTANFTLLPVPAESVYVHCEQLENLTKRYTLTARGLQGIPVNVRQGSEAGDVFNFWGVPPGHYMLRAEAADGNHSWYGTSDFDVAAGDTDVNVTLYDAPSLSGTVAVENAAEIRGGGAGPVMVVLRDETGNSRALQAGPGGRFSIGSIPPGRYRVAVSGADLYYLKGWSAEGGRRDGQTLEVLPGAVVRLQVAAGMGAGRITGTVYRDGRPLAEALVVLSPMGRAAESNSDGSYEFRGLPAAAYAVFAVEDGSDLEYGNPAAIRGYLGGAKKVQVGRGGSEDVRLDIGKAPATGDHRASAAPGF